ncbi:DUF6049 family protein [Microbacterium sp. 3J1]|uniref:DUF6049 family protein n=1 Tax=Microbacterium sp. 3J1 TaxID=861269 RepID=UPI000ADED126|nr:DUF6049 family protein [Microbacterium sp. 3J1]
MTATTLENGLRARLHRLARGSVVFAIVLATCGTGAGSAFAADGAVTDTTPVELHVTAGVRGTVAPGSATTASVTVQNDSQSRLSAGRVTVELNRTPLTDEQAVEAWLDDSKADGDFEQIGTDSVSPVDPDGAVTSTLPLAQESLGDLAPGVYPLRASLADAQDDDADAVTSTTVLVVTAAPSAPVAVMVPLTATPENGALLTADELSALTAAEGALTAALDGVAGTSAILAIDPSIPAAIRALGSAAPAQATEWLRQLDGLPNERFALQFGDADATTQAQAGLPELLRPTTLAPFLNPSNFAATAVDPGATPTAVPSPAPTDGPVLPDDEDLSVVEAAVPGILWPRSDVSAADLSVFSAYVGGTATTVVSSTAVGGEVGAHATIGGSDALVAEAAASDALSRAAGEEDAAIRQHWFAEANAHLYLSGQTSGGAPLLVGLDRDDARTADALKETISAVDSLGVGLEAVRAAPAATAALTTEPDASRATSLQGMLASEGPLTQFATILDDPQLLLSPQRIQIMRATAVGLSGEGFEEAVADVEAATRDTLEAVDIPPASTIQLLSANADLPFSVRNELPWPVNVRLTVLPSDTRLDVQRVTPWVIPAGTTTRVRVPVSARVGSGEVSLTLELSSPTGVPISQPETVRVSVRAEWETIGLAVFGGLIVLLLGLGFIRTVRRKRREAAEQPDAEQPEDAETDADAVRAPAEESNE